MNRANPYTPSQQAPSSPRPDQDGASPLRQAFDDVFDRLFGLTFDIAQIRLALLLLVAMFTWILMAFIMHPWPEWKLVISWMFHLIPSPAEINPYLQFFSDLFFRFFAWDVLARWLILIAPFYIGMQAATAYLADIFELSDEGISRQYVTQAAFAYPENYQVIHIRNGEVAQEDRNSPINHIGGPGVVDVSLENVAVFERVQLPWEIIGPENSFKRLEGFERLREVIDLREHHKELEIEGRTRDGIQVSIRNMRILFHVKRSDTSTSDESTGYTYDPESIKNLVFEEPLHDGHDVAWHNVITRLLREELERFISEHNLSEILASAVEPGHNITPGGLLAFIPRMELSNSLFDLRGEFVKRAVKHGVWLEWVDVGTWQVQGDTLTQQHIDAWKLTRQNQFRSSGWNIENLKEQTRLRELQKMTVELPILSFIQSAQQNRTRPEITRALLREFSGVLNRALLDLDKRDPAAMITIPPGLRKQIEKTLEWIRLYLKSSSGQASVSSSSRPQPVPPAGAAGGSSPQPQNSPGQPGEPAGQPSAPSTSRPPSDRPAGSGSQPAAPVRPVNTPIRSQPPPAPEPAAAPPGARPTQTPPQPGPVRPMPPAPDPTAGVQSAPEDQGRRSQPTRRPAPIPPGISYSPKETSGVTPTSPESTEPDQPIRPLESTEPEYIPLDDTDPQEPE